MVINQLTSLMATAYERAGFSGRDVRVISSNRPELCDYQSDSAFALAKQLKKSPREIAEAVVKQITKLDEFELVLSSAEFAMPGFINLKLSDKFINQNLQKMVNEKHFSLQQPKNKQTYFLDYGGPNIAKPLHVGHLRSAIVGESIKRLINFVGHKTISDVHLGDIGLQIGTVIYGLQQEGIAKDQITLQNLEFVYPKYSALAKENESVYEVCAEITKQMQDGNAEYNEWRDIITKISGDDILRIYDFLSVGFDIWEGESHAYKHIPAVQKVLENKKLLEESQGAKVVKLDHLNENPPMPPLIFQKSNGAYLYGTTDLATIYDRVNRFNPQNFIYITDFRQSLHFKQVFAVSKMSGIVSQEVGLKHLSFGTVKGNDGKPFKTRAGNAPKLDDLFEQVQEEYVNAKEENKFALKEDLNKIVNSIIKFADLQNHYERDYIFDIEKFSKISGKTGPYILYGYLRVNKVLQANEQNIASNFNAQTYGDADKKLRLKLLTLQSAVDMAFDQMAPSVIADYVYELSVLMNNFYEENRINQEQGQVKKSNWLLLLSLSSKVLKSLLSILAIDIPTIM